MFHLCGAEVDVEACELDVVGQSQGHCAGKNPRLRAMGQTFSIPWDEATGKYPAQTMVRGDDGSMNV